MCDISDIINNKYCIGCGLCVAVLGYDKLRMVKNKDGFFIPMSVSGGKINYDRDLCPGITVKQKVKKRGNEKIYGPFDIVSEGYSTDPEIRFKASSGGVITAILMFLFDNSLIDGVLHVGKDPTSSLKTEAHYSVSVSEVIDRAGSRYSPACLMEKLAFILKTGARIAVVGKPCDILAVRLFLSKYPQYKKQLIIALSFMCMGLPSIHATYRLVREMGCCSDDVSDFWYRGNGWPGKATVVDSQHNIYESSYDESWGQILGRDIHFRCKICPDGYGEFADISCGDAWNLKDGKPDFSEADGKSVIFVRTDIGKSIYAKVVENRYIMTKDFDIEKLQFIQASQFYRKRTVGARIAALKILGDRLINFQGFDFLTNLWQTGIRSIFGNIVGTLRRRKK
jgi:coenzyme F420 hydrogenase subunit beta